MSVPESVFSDYSSIPTVPLDEEGFTVSFDVNDTEGVKAFFSEYGFVVIKDAITEKEADDAYSDIWEYIEKLSDEMFKASQPNPKYKWVFIRQTQEPVGQPVRRDNVDSWLDYWPFVEGGKGIIGDGVVRLPAAWATRQSENLYKAFSLVLGCEELLVSCDRYGFMKPTKNIAFKTGTKDMEKWVTEGSWVHWDLNPWYWTGIAECPPQKDEVIASLKNAWKASTSQGLLITENNDVVDFKGYDKVQGLVALQDSTIEDGGFCCVPGFHKIIKQWAEATEMYHSGHFVGVKRTHKELISKLQKVPMRKRSLVIWTSCLPHCNYPNSSSRPRACQYIKMFPKVVVDEGILSGRTQLLKTLIPDSFTPSPLGRKLFGFDPY